MPDPRLLEQKIEQAELLLIGVMKMDEGTLRSTHFSVQEAMKNIDLGYLSDVYLEHWLELREMRLTVLTHIRNYPHGFFVALLESAVNQWVKIKGYNINEVRKDFMLIE